MRARHSGIVDLIDLRLGPACSSSDRAADSRRPSDLMCCGVTPITVNFIGGLFVLVPLHVNTRTSLVRRPISRPMFEGLVVGLGGDP